MYIYTIAIITPITIDAPKDIAAWLIFIELSAVDVNIDSNIILLLLIYTFIIRYILHFFHTVHTDSHIHYRIPLHIH